MWVPSPPQGPHLVEEVGWEPVLVWTQTTLPSLLIHTQRGRHCHTFVFGREVDLGSSLWCPDPDLVLIVRRAWHLSAGQMAL